MILDPYNPVFNTCFVYILLILLLVHYKPSVIYDKKKKKYRDFGIKKSCSLLPLPIISILLAIIVYVIFLKINLKATKN